MAREEIILCDGCGRRMNDEESAVFHGIDLCEACEAIAYKLEEKLVIEKKRPLHPSRKQALKNEPGVYMLYGSEIYHFREIIFDGLLNGNMSVTMDYNRLGWRIEYPNDCFVYRVEVLGE